MGPMLVAMPSYFSWASDLPNHQKLDSLYRADFLITGISCATCLMHIERDMQKIPGVIKAAVSVYRPYPALIIFDGHKTSWPDILKALNEHPIKIEQVTQEHITELPVLLIPKVPSAVTSTELHQAEQSTISK